MRFTPTVHLVVAAATAILAAMFMPALRQARERVKDCLTTAIKFLNGEIDEKAFGTLNYGYVNYYGGYARTPSRVLNGVAKFGKVVMPSRRPRITDPGLQNNNGVWAVPT